MTPLAPLPSEFGVLECTGRDAAAFLQSQLATDLRGMAAGGALLAALLAANGRVLAAGTLLCADEQRFGWVLHRDLLQTMAGHLRRFVLRSKVTLIPMPGLMPSQPSAADGSWPIWRDAAGRELGLAATADKAPDPDVFARSALLAGWVDFSARLSDQYLAQMLDLHRFGAIALDKGCYPGQEIVARTHYLGRIKRGLRLLRSEVAPESGLALADAGGKVVGEWLHGRPDAHGWLGLAVVDQAAAEVHGSAAQGPVATQSQTILAAP